MARAVPMPASGDGRRPLPSCFLATPLYPMSSPSTSPRLEQESRANMTINRRTLLAGVGVNRSTFKESTV